MILVGLVLSAIFLSVPAVSADPPPIEPIVTCGDWCEGQCNAAEDSCDLACLQDECGTPENELCEPGCYAGCASAYFGCLMNCTSGFPEV